MDGFKPRLRISVFPMPTNIMAGDSRTIAGDLGFMMMDYYQFFNNFNYSYVWVTDNTLTGVKRGNENYTGVLGQFYNNESDALLIPFERSPEMEAAVFGEVLSWSNVLMVAPVDLRSYSDQVLTQLFRFSVEVVFLLLLTMFAFATMLNRSEGWTPGSRVRDLLSGCWHMIQMLLLQSKLVPVSRAGRLLTATTLLGVLFWLQIWYNQMHSDMVAYDNTRTAMTMEDVLSMNKTPVMTYQEAATITLENKAQRNPDSTLAHLMQKADYLHFPNVPKAKLQDLLTNMGKYVVMLSGRFMAHIEGRICVGLRFASMPADHKTYSLTAFDFIISSDQIAEFLTGSWYSRHLRPEYVQILRKKLTQVRESGIGLWLEYAAGQAVRQQDRKLNAVTGVDPQCVYRSIDEYMDKNVDNEHKIVTLANIADVFQMTATALLISAAFFVLEKSGLVAAAALKYRAVTRTTEANNNKKNNKNKEKRKISCPTPIVIVVSPAQST